MIGEVCKLSVIKKILPLLQAILLIPSPPSAQTHRKWKAASAVFLQEALSCRHDPSSYFPEMIQGTGLFTNSLVLDTIFGFAFTEPCSVCHASPGSPNMNWYRLIICTKSNTALFKLVLIATYLYSVNAALCLCQNLFSLENLNSLCLLALPIRS